MTLMWPWKGVVKGILKMGKGSSDDQLVTHFVWQEMWLKVRCMVSSLIKDKEESQCENEGWEIPFTQLLPKSHWTTFTTHPQCDGSADTGHSVRITVVCCFNNKGFHSPRLIQLLYYQMSRQHCLGPESTGWFYLVWRLQSRNGCYPKSTNSLCPKQNTWKQAWGKKAWPCFLSSSVVHLGNCASCFLNLRLYGSRNLVCQRGNMTLVDLGSVYTLNCSSHSIQNCSLYA